ncbi:M56 family metallopeptidase [Oscillospiraceae bacterium OttesenSCG-928-F05]|nr:M56 family metallopeptidase [Oscillospiraceae bacterium OttesenSCG-928-F05]
MKQYSLLSLSVLIAASILRLGFAVELPFTKVFHSHVILPFVLSVTNYELAPPLKLWQLVVALSCAVAALLLIRYSVKLIRLYANIRSLKVIQDVRTESLAEEVITASSIKSYRLYISKDVPAPMSVGFFKPIILLPDDMLLDRDEEIRYIIRHEIQHFHHKDIWAKTFVNVLVCLIWWNYFAYLLRDDVEQILELNCDLKVSEKWTIWKGRVI